MEIRLIDEAAGTDFVFPVNPEEVRITRGKGYETLNMLSYGEFDMATAERVREITFSSFSRTVGRSRDAACAKGSHAPADGDDEQQAPRSTDH